MSETTCIVGVQYFLFDKVVTLKVHRRSLCFPTFVAISWARGQPNRSSGTHADRERSPLDEDYFPLSFGTHIRAPLPPGEGVTYNHLFKRTPVTIHLVHSMYNNSQYCTSWPRTTVRPGPFNSSLRLLQYTY